MSCEGLPYSHDMCIYVGDDSTHHFKWETEEIVDGVSTKTPVDLTGGEMWITFSKEYGTPLLTKESEAIVDPTLGEFSFYISPEESRTLMGDAYCTRVLMYDVEFRGNVATPPVTITTVVKGELTLHADVTRAA